MSSKTKIVIVGGGVGGYPAAIRASRMGAEVTLIERRDLGGTCLNRGCVPTKALLQSGNVIETIKESEVYGVKCKGYEFDYAKAMARKNAVVEQLTMGVAGLLQRKKVKVIKGTAAFIDARTLEIAETGEKITGDKIIIASGSIPSKVPIEGIDSPDVLNSDQVLDEMMVLPKSVVIIGGGVIGVEFAQYLNSMGCAVTILEMMPNLVFGVDNEISDILQKTIVKSGVKVVCNAAVKSIAKKADENIVTYTLGDKTETVSGEKVLLTVGRKPDYSMLNIEKIGLKTENGSIVVNEFMETNVPNIYAVGDVIGGIMLAHLASAEGECAVSNALGHKEAMSYKAVPACIYTKPEVGTVGLTEEKAKEAGYDVQVGRFPMRATAKALVVNEIEGMVKIVSDKKYGEVLGVHIIGPHATDMIAEAVLGMNLEMTAEDLANTIHPHPTISEAVMEAAMTLTGGCIHMP
jgi:dihydrolipoamide dehydrogenase